MGKKEKTETMEDFLKSLSENINIEPHLDEDVVTEIGFFRRAVTTAGLWKFVTAKPHRILAKAVAEILLNLRVGEETSSFTNPQEGTPVIVELSSIARAFDLPMVGPASLNELDMSTQVEYARFAKKRGVKFGNPKQSNIRNDLKAPFNLICELFTKSVLCGVGSLSQLSDTKIFATSVIVDSLTGTSFNWHRWFINQIHEVAADFKFEEGSDSEIVRRGKLRFFSKISYALETKFPNMRWTGKNDTAVYKKNTLYYDSWKTEKLPMDRDCINVVVLPSVPVAESCSETEEESQAPSPSKRAPRKARSKRPQRLRSVTTIIEASEAEEQPLEKIVEESPQPSSEKVQPLPSPPKDQTPPTQTQIPTQPLQEPQISSTAIPTTQPPLSPQESTHSSFQIPDLPFLGTDLNDAFKLFSAPLNPQKETTQPETTKASTSSSSSSSAESADTAQTTKTADTIPIIIPDTPTPPTEKELVLERYSKDREQAAEIIRERYPSVKMADDFFTRAVDFLTYITYRGTEYYKIFNLRKAMEEEVIEAMEVEVLKFAEVDGFHTFINEANYWEVLDAKVKKEYPDAPIPEREPSQHELQLIKEHEAEVEAKEAEISNLQSVITKKEGELSTKGLEITNLRADCDRRKKELEELAVEKTKLVEEKASLSKRVEEMEKSRNEINQSLSDERSRLREVNAKMVEVSGEKEKLEKKLETEKEEKRKMRENYRENINKATGSVEKLEKQISNHEAKIVTLDSELTRAKLNVHRLEKEVEILKSKLDEANTELESRRKAGKDVALKQAQLAVKINKAERLAGDFTVRMVGAAQVYLSLRQKENAIATAKAELEASKDFWNFNVQEERKRMKDEIEAELDARFKDVEPLEELMRSVKEREDQCKYLLEEISVKTAELVLSHENVFVTRAEKMLHEVLSKLTDIHQSISGTVTTTTIPGSLDDAKKGENTERAIIQLQGVGGASTEQRRIEVSGLIEGGNGGKEEVNDEARAEQARRKGKEKVPEELEGESESEEEEPRKPTAEKLLGSAIAANPIVGFLNRKQKEQQIAADEAYARSLEKEFNLAAATLAAGTNESSQVPTSSSAPASTTVPAPSLALASVSTEATPASKAAIQMPPPPPPGQKAALKRSTPETREDDSAAKRQKMQQVITERASRSEKRLKKKEEKKKRREKDKEVKEKRLMKLDERIEAQWNEVKQIQHALARSAYIPHVPEESDAVRVQAWMDTAKVTLKEMIDSGRYTAEEHDFIRKRINDMSPKWNGDASVQFNKIMKKLKDRTEDELAMRRDNHPDSRQIEDFIPRDLRDTWLMLKDKFIKAYYYWQVVPDQDKCSRIEALNNFLRQYNDRMRRKIFTLAEEAKPLPLIVKIPAVKKFPMPLQPNSNIPYRKVLDAEVDEALRLESRWRENHYNIRTMEPNVLSAYFLEKKKEEKEEKKEEEKEEKGEKQDETAGNL